MDQATISLEAAADKFQLWRQTRKHKRERTPNHLKKLVSQLTIHHSKNQITKALKINHTFFNTSKPSGSQPPDNKLDFTPFQLVKPVKKESGFVCKIIKPDGTSLIIEGPNPALVIHAFLCSS